VACVNGNFVGSTCFGEAWTRAEDNGEPTGAIAVIMSTINQSWNPPMRGQDIMNDILSELEDGNIKRTFGGITMNGCMGMNDAYGSDGDVMTDTWTIFGDPSVMVRTAIPQAMVVDHPSTIFLGATSLAVTCDAEGGLAVLSQDGEIIGSATVEGGTANISFAPLNNLGVMDLVITAFNYVPYESTVEIVPASGPFIVSAGSTVDDSNGNNDGFIDYTESILLTIDMSNVGIDDANNVNCTLSTENVFITITDEAENYGTIIVDDTVSVENGFAFDVANNIPDGTQISFVVTSEDEATREVWESTFNLYAHAPILGLSTFVIDDNQGNQNGGIDPGETVDIIVDLSNLGSSDAFNVIANLSSSSEYITINSFDISYGDMMGIDTISGIFSVTANDDTPEGTEVEFVVEITADYEIGALDSFTTYLGQKPVLIVDFTSNTPSADAMLECFTELNVGADLQLETLPEEVHMYQSIFIILGVYPNNHVITDEEGAVLAGYLENGGRIYMEGGDTWAYDTQTVAHEKFMINGLADGNDDLETIIGHEGDILEGYLFEYDGPNSYIDHIAPLVGANLILQNEGPVYGTTVSYANDIYKTIGSSACFGGLVDQEDGSNKDGLMAEYLYFFDVTYLWTGMEEIRINENAINAYPNPFNNTVSISVDLKESQNVEIIIYSLAGQKIKTLVDAEQKLGSQIYSWVAEDVPAGIYFYSVKTGSQTFTKKLVLTK